MSSEPQEDFLDQELRNVFQDYNLPPSEHMHVWAGVAERIGSLPAPRTGLAYRLALPVTTAVLGVAVGWLLPRPAVQPVPAQPKLAASRGAHLQPAAVARPMVVLAPKPELAIEPVAAAVPAIPAKPLAAAGQPVRVKHLQPAAKYTAAQPITSDSAHPETSQPTVSSAVPSDSAAGLAAPDAVVASAATALPSTAMPTVGTDSLPAVPEAPAVAQVAPASHLSPAAEHPAKAKPEGNNEKIAYHKPVHRQTEQRVGPRRWVSRLSKSVRHLFGR